MLHVASFSLVSCLLDLCGVKHSGSAHKRQNDLHDFAGYGVHVAVLITSKWPELK